MPLYVLFSSLSSIVDTDSSLGVSTPSLDLRIARISWIIGLVIIVDSTKDITRNSSVPIPPETSNTVLSTERPLVT
ncbi:hypothetical protein D3C75_1072800 [compost metagenome]